MRIIICLISLFVPAIVYGQLLEVPQAGKVCFSVRYGSWTIDLAKGKPSVEVESGEALVKALETIKTAVEAGELDSQIEIASAKLRSGFGK